MLAVGVTEGVCYHYISVIKTSLLLLTWGAKHIGGPEGDPD